ncbi:MAG: protein-L-isoaspartate(D-aspartate) O-methyltransferase [Planctomycetales bacterium]|nr:protein-L-isoaspartate(D-aspartate) O-methyltransferase [Planctomycetales bacterium]
MTIFFRVTTILTVTALLAAGWIESAAHGQSAALFRAARMRMVDEEIVAAGVENPRVIAAMRETPRHEFMPLNERKYAYLDMALPIGEGQTISPPFVVASMTEYLDPQPADRVLEIGTGSGYQAAVLSGLVKDVYSIEIVASLAHKAERTLARLGYENVHTKAGDGYLGWPEYAPFDKIIVTCSPEKVPLALVNQLREGGRIVIPVGERYRQNLYLLEKQDGKMVSKALRATLFVPMTGKAEQRRQVQPDPKHPQIENGSFEQSIGDPPRVDAWHYQRQVEWVQEPAEAREGDYFVKFSNEDPGRYAQMIQGFAVDGRKVASLDFTIWVQARNARFGQDRSQWPRLLVTFYDQRRATISTASVGPWMGSFDWREESKSIDVPQNAREAIVVVGLLGGIGELSLDSLRMEPQSKFATRP